MNVLPYPLGGYGKSISSQADEDGIIEVILAHISMPPYFVEFGVDPTQGNCIELHRAGWSGLFMDAHKGWQRDCPIPIKKHFVTAGNVEELFANYRVPVEFGVLSIDIDGQDYWVWRAISHRPALVVIEYNGKIGIGSGVVMPRNDDWVLRVHIGPDGQQLSDQFYGASLGALDRLAHVKGYTLVYANGVNAFFVRDDMLSNRADFQYADIYRRWPTHHIEDPYALGFVDVESLG